MLTTKWIRKYTKSVQSQATLNPFNFRIKLRVVLLGLFEPVD